MALNVETNPNFNNTGNIPGKYVRTLNGQYGDIIVPIDEMVDEYMEGITEDLKHDLEDYLEEWVEQQEYATKEELENKISMEYLEGGKLKITLN